jgi:hypothetical protein
LEVEQKLKTVSEKLAELEQKLIGQIEAKNKAEALLKDERQAKIEAGQKIQFDTAKEKAVAETTQKANVTTTAAAQVKLQLAEPANVQTGTGTCECCGKDNVKKTELYRIDSGEFFCLTCFQALKTTSV